MQYGTIIPGRFLSRPNRFIAMVETEHGVERVHVKNTGRCRELLVPGAAVYLAKGENPNRKTAWDLVTVDKGGVLINMDAQAPNALFHEWVAAGGFLPDVMQIRPEYRYGNSRLDFCLETLKGPHLVEVKGVTLEEGGTARFPDAPTERGIKHIQELEQAVKAGLDATLFFVVQFQNARSVAPNDETHPAFGQALRQAASVGVQVCAWDCTVTPWCVQICQSVPVIL